MKGNAYLIASFDFSIGLGWGPGLQYGIFWRYATVYDYMKANFRTTSIGYVIGVDFHELVKDFNSKGLRGIGLSTTTGFSSTTSSYTWFAWELRRGFNYVALRKFNTWLRRVLL